MKHCARRANSRPSNSQGRVGRVCGFNGFEFDGVTVKYVGAWFDAYPVFMFPELRMELVNGGRPVELFNVLFPKILDLLGQGRVLLIDTIFDGGSMNRTLERIDAALAQRIRNGKIEMEVFGVIDAGKARQSTAIGQRAFRSLH